MADALQKAPLKKKGQEVDTEQTKSKEDEIFSLLGIDLDPNKRYVFELAKENPDREFPVIDARANRALPKKKFKPFQNIIFTSQIVWKNQRVNIRYYDGCDTIFVSDQPKEKDSIDQFIKATKKRNFLDGRFSAYGDEKMLLAFMYAASWNGDSLFKTRTSDTIYVPLNKAAKAAIEDSRLQEIEKAIQNAKEASDMKMRIHADYLGISDIDEDTGNELTPEEIRIQYKKAAVENPVGFNKSYGDTSIEVKFYINKALSSGLIKYKGLNKATWKTGSEICDISGLKTHEGVAAKLLEFSQLTDGEDFVLQLKSLFNN